jgi:hypothetical protein
VDNCLAADTLSPLHLCESFPPMRNRRLLVVSIFIAALLLPAAGARAQSGGYEVTARLDPFFIHPTTGKNVTEGEPFSQVNGWERGADGRVYGVRYSRGGLHGHIFELIQISPTTGAVQILAVGRSYGADYYDLVRGLNGRLYFYITDGFGWNM